jgi:hypothetical protein
MTNAAHDLELEEEGVDPSKQEEHPVLKLVGDLKEYSKGQEAKASQDVHEDVEAVMSGKESVSEQAHSKAVNDVQAVTGIIDTAAESSITQKTLNGVVRKVYDLTGSSNFVDRQFKKLPPKLQKYIVKTGGAAITPATAMLPKIVAVPLLFTPMGAAVASAAATTVFTSLSILAKTGLISYKGEISPEGEIDLKDTVSISPKTGKTLGFLVKALAKLSDDCKEISAIASPLLKTAEGIDRLLNNARADLLKYKQEIGDLDPEVKIMPGPFQKNPENDNGKAASKSPKTQQGSRVVFASPKAQPRRSRRAT